MPNPNQMQPGWSAHMGQLLEQLSQPPSDAELMRKVLEALERIESKLSPPQSAILTGPEVERVFKALGHQGES